MAFRNNDVPQIYQRVDPNGNIYYADHEHISIAGLYYYPNYLTEEEERSVIELIDSRPWKHDICRRTQHYGYTYYHTRHNILTMQPVTQPDEHTGDLSDLQFIIDRLMADKIFPEDHPPTQILVNEYLNNMGIKGHIDNTSAFGDVIISLSLNAPAFMTMRSCADPNIVMKVLMEERSLLVMTEDARFLWRHGITEQKKVWVPSRKQTILRDDSYRRLSLTIREIKVSGTKKVKEGDPDDEAQKY
jgi:alkylated DNA repair dioxygenase AlkB